MSVLNIKINFNIFVFYLRSEVMQYCYKNKLKDIEIDNF